MTADPVTAPTAPPDRGRARAPRVGQDTAAIAYGEPAANSPSANPIAAPFEAGELALCVPGPAVPSSFVKVIDLASENAPENAPESASKPAAFARRLAAPPRPLVPHRYNTPKRLVLAASEAENGSAAILISTPPAAVPRPSIAATLPPVSRDKLTEPVAPTELAAPVVPFTVVPTVAPQIAAVAPLSSGLSPFELPAGPPSATTFDATDQRGFVPVAAKIAKIAVLIAGVWAAAVVLLIVAYRFVDPPLSSLMVQQRLSGQDIVQDWVSLEEVSPQIIRAVLLSEDGRFCQHSGVDFQEMQNAIERAGEGPARGASTISMQVTKNLFLWPSKSYVRKAIEIPLTYLIEALWNKRRILEVYLNIAEWGPGIFGVEAASEFHFGKPARQLNEREAARLAVALPNPFTRDAGDPGPRTQRLAGDIQARMRAAPASQTACVTRAE